MSDKHNGKRFLNRNNVDTGSMAPYPIILHPFLAKRPAVHLKSCDANQAPSLLISHITKTPGLCHLPKSTKNIYAKPSFTKKKKKNCKTFLPFVPSPHTLFMPATKPCLMAPGEKRPRLQRLFPTKRA